MIFANPLIDLGIAFLVACVLAEYFKFRNKADKGFMWLALAGVWFIFAGSFALTPTLASYVGTGWYSAAGQMSIAGIFEIIAWIFALIGSLFVAYQILVEK